jgi:hypothetical protein
MQRRKIVTKNLQDAIHHFLTITSPPIDTCAAIASILYNPTPFKGPTMFAIESIRRVTHDSNHNAFTGAAYLADTLYIAYRQGDSHVDESGKLVVLRSRDHGKSFDNAHVARGSSDTRDAHLYTAGNRLFLTGFTLINSPKRTDRTFHSGTSYTDNGLNWSPWTPYTGTDKHILWRPEFFKGKHYCAGYTVDETAGKNPTGNKITWFQSDDGLHWSAKYTIHAGADEPNECSLAFKPDGTAIMLVRRENADKKPLLMTAQAPYDKWTKQELDIRIGGPCLWLVGDDIYLSGRWYVTPRATHVAIWRMENGLPVMQMVLPSGPGFDCSYMSRAQRPNGSSHFALVYYSGHDAPLDPNLNQWTKPSIYIADAVFIRQNFIQQWQHSAVQPHHNQWSTLQEPDLAGQSLQWLPIQAAAKHNSEAGFVDAHHRIDSKPGVVYFTTTFDIGPTDAAILHLGYDGPIKAWVNGQSVADLTGANPATPDKNSIKIKTNHGTNRLTIALNTNNGLAWGIYARVDAIARKQRA